MLSYIKSLDTVLYYTWSWGMFFDNNYVFFTIMALDRFYNPQTLLIPQDTNTCFPLSASNNTNAPEVQYCLDMTRGLEYNNQVPRHERVKFAWPKPHISSLIKVYDLYNHLDRQAWELQCETANSTFSTIRNICIPSITLLRRSVTLLYFGMDEEKKLIPYIIIARFSHLSKPAFVFDSYCTWMICRFLSVSNNSRLNT
jgi:hypothetical protein